MTVGETPFVTPEIAKLYLEYDKIDCKNSPFVFKK